jgi:quinol monooxygenase YgiN
MPSTIVANITAVPGKVDFLRSQLEMLITPTRAEAGCLQYDLHVDTADPHVFLFFENWETRDLWQDHMNADHIKQFSAATQGAIAAVVLNEMTQVG